jgi:predicted RNA binding protein YcfA (HicA-like mRNA interferase family)
MPKIPGVSVIQAQRVFEKIGFRVERQGKHLIMSRGKTVIVIPRHNPINAFTMGGIAKDAGLTPDEFRRLL